VRFLGRAGPPPARSARCSGWHGRAARSRRTGEIGGEFARREVFCLLVVNLLAAPGIGRRLTFEDVAHLHRGPFVAARCPHAARV